jgi:hypothetical protein
MTFLILINSCCKSEQTTPKMNLHHEKLSQQNYIQGGEEVWHIGCWQKQHINLLAKSGAALNSCKMLSSKAAYLILNERFMKWRQDIFISDERHCTREFLCNDIPHVGYVKYFRCFPSIPSSHDKNKNMPPMHACACSNRTHHYRSIPDG